MLDLDSTFSAPLPLPPIRCSSLRTTAPPHKQAHTPLLAAPLPPRPTPVALPRLSPLPPQILLAAFNCTLLDSEGNITDPYAYLNLLCADGCVAMRG